MEPLQLSQRVDRVGRADAVHLQVRDLELLDLVDRQSAHLEALLRTRLGLAAVRRRSGGDEDHAIQAFAVDGRLGCGKVAEVDGIERPTQHADPHGWYSNSMPEIVTVSPGLTPAASSAVLTPRRSSSD